METKNIHILLCFENKILHRRHSTWNYRSLHYLLHLLPRQLQPHYHFAIHQHHHFKQYAFQSIIACRGAQPTCILHLDMVKKRPVGKRRSVWHHANGAIHHDSILFLNKNIS
jgi:hypothetical protein